MGEPTGPHFALLAKIAARNGLAKLSMGMSADFELAIRFGATSVRVGTALFRFSLPFPLRGGVGGGGGCLKSSSRPNDPPARPPSAPTLPSRGRVRVWRSSLTIRPQPVSTTSASPGFAAASTASRSSLASATQPWVSVNSGRARWRKIAEPMPGTTGSSL